MAHRLMLLATPTLFVSLMGLAASAAGACPKCGHTTDCELEYVECTVMVPKTVSQTRVYKRTLLRPEKRERKATTYKYVPETREVTHRRLVLVPQQRQRTEVYFECVPVKRVIVKKCTVEVPYLKEIKREYKVCVPVTREVIDPQTGGCSHVCDWQVEVRTCVDKVPACRSEEREYKTEVTEYQTVQRTRDVDFVQLVAKTRLSKEQVEVLTCVPVESTRMCTVMVPYEAEQPVEVRRCILVPKQVKVPVCACCGCKQS